ncbi:MAG: hypothetical protein U9N38_00045 [Thermodesulfobacteriota bacterium]|nr:hypothetical protein [Thermodesulfobacteriota bacterium]
MVAACVEILSARMMNSYGHGLLHARKVAWDAGAIVFIEGRHSIRTDNERHVLLAHIAGILHDIKRTSRDHARRGAEEAKKLLIEFAQTN